MIADNRSSGQQEPSITWLCEEHWRSVYVAARRFGLSHQDGEDLTQDFFAWFISKDRLAHFNGSRDELWGFASVLLKRFILNRWRHNTTIKRGGGQAHVSLEAEIIAGRENGFAELETPSVLAEKKDLHDAMDEAHRTLRERFRHAGLDRKFEALSPYLTDGAPSIPGAALANQLGIKHNALRTAVSRLRKNYRQVIESLLPVEDLVMLPSNRAEKNTLKLSPFIIRSR